MISENILHMKRVDLFMLALLMLVSSCSDKFEVVDPAEPVPVIYFMMNPEDSVFYLSLTRTFSGDLDAYELACDPDRVFYDSADIRLEAWEGQYKVQELQFSLSDRVKNPGLFPQVPGNCYEAINTFHREGEIDSYRIVVQAEGMTDSAFARIKEIRPSPQPPWYPRQIDFYPEGYRYDVEKNPLLYQQLLCKFHYQVFKETWVDKTETFILRKRTNAVGLEDDPILRAEFFFTRLAANIKPVHDTIIRKFVSFDLIFYTADQHYLDYVETYEKYGDLDLPPKGNIINGYGLFSMYTIKRYEDMVLGQQSLDSLSMGQFTRHLGFVRW